MKSPQAIKGEGNAPTTSASFTGSGGRPWVKIGDKTYAFQGSAQNPYTINLAYHDDRAGICEMCTCPNWKLERNKIVKATGDFQGYRCKHLKQLIKDLGVDDVDPAIQKRADAIIAQFRRDKK